MGLTIGVDVGGTKVAAGVVDDEGKVLARIRRPTPSSSPGDVERTIAEVVTELRVGHEVEAVGIGAAGFIDRDRLHESLLDQTRLGSPVRVPLRLRPREKALVDVDVVMASDAGIAEGEKLWFLMPSSEARQIREMTTVPAAPDNATAGAR